MRGLRPMRSAVLWVLLALLVGGAPRLALAEMAHTPRQATLRAKPSSSSKSLDKVPADTDLAVLERSPDGKWVKVLFGDNEGWLPLKELQIIADPAPTPEDVPAGEAPKPDGAKAGAGGAATKVRPEVWVEDSRYHAAGAPAHVVVTVPTADLVDRPKEGARKVGQVKKGDRLAISRSSRDSAFYLVELEGGRTAWIATAAVEGTKVDAVPTRPLPPSATDRSAAAEETAPAVEAPEPPAEVVARKAAVTAVGEQVVRRRFHARAEAGFAIGRVDQQFTSSATGPLSNYGDRTGLVGVDALLQLDGSSGGPWFGGVSAGYRFGGGADVTRTLKEATGDRAVVLGLRTHDLEGLGLLGYRAAAAGGLAITAHAGARMTLALIDQSYEVPVPSERVLALQIGLGLDVPRLVGGLGLTLGVDWLPIGSRAQAANLGEGQDAGTSGYAANLSLHYAFTDAIGLFVAGRYVHSATRFDGVAERDPAIASAERTTTLAGLALGLRYTR